MSALTYHNKTVKFNMGEARSLLHMGMDNILCWNVRGLNAPNKQNEVKLLCNKENIGLAGLLETKVKA